MHAVYTHANVNNKTVHKVPSTNCRCEEAETKATVTLMASLVIKRPLMYAATQQTLLSPSSSMPLSPFLPGSTSFFINAVFRECSFAQSPRHTSDIWLTLMSLSLAPIISRHEGLHNASFVAILDLFPVGAVGGNQNYNNTRPGIQSLLQKRWYAITK